MKNEYIYLPHKYKCDIIPKVLLVYGKYNKTFGISFFS